MRTRTVPWNEVVDWYEQLRRKGWQLDSMLQLIRFLASSDYAAGLFAYTSHDVLGLGRVADFGAGDAELRVEFNLVRQVFRFSYSQGENDRTPWSQQCGAADGQRTLEHILQRRLRWFHRGE
jgi:hypothetical protein